MAKILDPHTIEEIVKRAPQSNYNFAKWSDGQVWQLVRGIDFHCNVGSISTYLYRYAERTGKKVRVSARRSASGRINTITFQFSKRDAKQSPTRCVVWDALRERIGLSDPCSEVRGFKRELQFATAAGDTLL